HHRRRSRRRRNGLCLCEPRLERRAHRPQRTAGREEPFVGELLERGLVEAGVDVRLGVSPNRIDRDEQGIVRASLDGGGVLEADEILAAAGRRPYTSGLGLAEVGLADRLSVDETMRVDGTDWLYAVGDTNGRALLTHQGKYQARAAGE